METFEISKQRNSEVMSYYLLQSLEAVSVRGRESGFQKATNDVQERRLACRQS